MKNYRTYRRLGHLFESITRFFWRKDPMACDYCGALVGFDSSINKWGFTCLRCLESLELGRIRPYIKS